MDTTDHTNPTAPSAQPVLAPEVRLGITRISVLDLERSLPLYEQGLGLERLRQGGNVVSLGTAGDTVLELVEEPAAQPSGRHGGLFHVALLYPSRGELARVGQRLLAHRVVIEGASDHGTHEAFYLRDADGNGLELAADRSRDQWPARNEQYAHGPQPLDLRGLLSLVDGEELRPHAAAGVTVGHMHLHVGDIDAALAFYRDIVGFEVQARLPTAAFVSLGGYHHHLGLNVWKGEGVPPAPDDAVGLRHWTVQVPSALHVDALANRLGAGGVEHTVAGGVLTVRDPWNSELRVEPLPI